MSVTAKLALALATCLGTVLLWKVLRIEKMLRHTQNCIALGNFSDLFFKTRAEAKRRRGAKP
jgi:hypothetical protein